MKTWLGNFWEGLRSGYWFLPATMAAIAFVLSLLLIEMDERQSFISTEGLGWLYKNKPDGAREVLSTIAGSMITVTGVVFSITIVALSLASSQFGPHVLRSFMRDRGNQIVLGTFISTFLYSLMVLRTIRSGENDAFVPHLAVTFSVVLAIVSVGVLIFFLHHSVQSIQGPNIVAKVAREFDEALENIFPEKLGEGTNFSEEPTSDQIHERIQKNFGRFDRKIPASSEGHLQAVANETLMSIAIEHNLVIQITTQPGAFIAQHDVLARVWPEDRASDEIADALCDAFLIGDIRTHEQDLKMPVEQLAEIAVRSLSPGINDPFTALECINRLGAGLRKLAGRAIPSSVRFDQEKNPRVVADPVGFPEVIKVAFDQIIHFGRNNPGILLCIVSSLAKIAPEVHREEDRAAIRYWASVISTECRKNISDETQPEIGQQYRLVMERLFIKPDKQNAESN